jgi:hypothetical protein
LCWSTRTCRIMQASNKVYGLRVVYVDGIGARRSAWRQRGLPAASLGLAPPASVQCPVSIKIKTAASRVSSTLLLLPACYNMTSLFQPIAAEPVPEKDGLIHGVSALELQKLGEECVEAKTKAYCRYRHGCGDWWQYRKLIRKQRPILAVPRRRIAPPAAGIERVATVHHHGRQR